MIGPVPFLTLCDYWSSWLCATFILTYLHERPHKNHCPAWTAGKDGIQTWDLVLATCLHLHSADELLLSVTSETNNSQTHTNTCSYEMSVTTQHTRIYYTQQQWTIKVIFLTCNSSWQHTKLL